MTAANSQDDVTFELWVGCNAAGNNKLLLGTVAASAATIKVTAFARLLAYLSFHNEHPRCDLDSHQIQISTCTTAWHAKAYTLEGAFVSTYLSWAYDCMPTEG